MVLCGYSLLLINIQARMESFNPAQKRVAAYILENFHKLEGMTSRELAEKCSVTSQP